MKAVVCERYGPPEGLKLRDLPRPVPKAGEILIKVRAAAVNAADWHLMRADPFLVRLMFGPFRPKFPVLGADVSGVVEEAGPGVTRFKPGDEVFGDLSGGAWGAYAEYAVAGEEAVVAKPSGLSFEEAAAVPLSSVTALQGLRDGGRVRPGERVLINGAAGGVGTFAVQIAKALGADVTAVCSTRNLDQARSLGADHVIDYTREDFTTQATRYDMILGTNGYHPLTAYKRVLAPGGRYVMVGGAGKQMAEAMMLGPWFSMTGGRRMGNVIMKPNRADLEFVKGLIEAGKVRPVIDRRFPLEQVPAAIAYLETGHARGKVVIAIG